MSAAKNRLESALRGEVALAVSLRARSGVELQSDAGSCLISLNAFKWHPQVGTARVHMQAVQARGLLAAELFGCVA